MTAIIVDDEPRAIHLLESYLEHFSQIHLVGTFRNGLKAFKQLSQQPVDLVFLDINMPHISGIDLSRLLSPETKVIFTTAYSDYAVESYEVEAVDYLLKPISFERFAKAVSKILVNPAQHADPTGTVLVKSGTEVHQLQLDDLLYLEKDGNYLTYHLREQQVLARSSVADALLGLPDWFKQIHKSYAVNLRRVNRFDRESVHINDRQLPVGPSFRERVLDYLRK